MIVPRHWSEEEFEHKLIRRLRHLRIEGAAGNFCQVAESAYDDIHTQSGDTVTAFDGRSGWVAADKPVTLLQLSAGGEIDGARLEADLAVPAHIKNGLSAWTGILAARVIEYVPAPPGRHFL